MYRVHINNLCALKIRDALRNDNSHQWGTPMGDDFKPEAMVDFSLQWLVMQLNGGSIVVLLIASLNSGASFACTVISLFLFWLFW